MSGVFTKEQMKSTFKTGMTDKTLVNIKYVSGFEKFGMYEDWGQGWEIEGSGMLKSGHNIVACNKDLEQAWDLWLKRYEAALRIESRGEEVNNLAILRELKQE